MKEIKTAEILCVGTELLLGDIVNTNAAFLSQRLAELGIAVYHQSVVGDNPERLLAELEAASKRCDLVITSGGLGPTYDDLTKETISAFFGKKLVRDDATLERIRSYFAQTGRVMTPNNEKQADIPEGAIAIDNAYGTAPGVIVEGDTLTAIMLPGPPRELIPLFNEKVLPYLEARTGSVIVSKNVQIFGLGESFVENMLLDLMKNASNPSAATYADSGELRIRVTARADSKDKAEEMCDELIEKIKTTDVAPHIYGIDSGSVEATLVSTLKEKQMTIATAESCTGGLIAKLITDVSGSSAVFLGGAVTYANSAKEALVGVRHETLEAHGAVSEQVAIQMARGVREALESDIGISTTGIAGPTGGTSEKPVGTVYVGISSEKGDRAILLRLSPQRERSYIRLLAAKNALFTALCEAGFSTSLS